MTDESNTFHPKHFRAGSDPRVYTLPRIAAKRREAMNETLGDYRDNDTVHASIFEMTEELADAWNYIAVFFEHDRPASDQVHDERVLRIRIANRLIEAHGLVAQLARLLEHEDGASRRLLYGNEGTDR